MVEDPDGGWLLTGRISLATHPWLADHAVLDTVIVPGTAFLELALRAGEQAGAEVVEELTLQAPLVLTEQGAVQVQVAVGAGEEGRRSISIHSRPETSDEGEAGEWTLHASGSLSAEQPPAPEPFSSWPPEGAEPVETADLYERLEEIGFQYGPAFQGLGAAWQEGEYLYAEVSLAEVQSEEAGRFAIHPALLDSALHGALLAVRANRGAKRRSALRLERCLGHRRRRRCPAGASGKRGGAVSLHIADPGSAPLARGRVLSTAPGLARGDAGRRAPKAPLSLDWSETPLPEASEPPRRRRLIDTREWDQEEPVEASHAFAAKALEAIQAHLADEETNEARLVFLTEGALGAGDAEPDLPAATLAGLLRSAISEHPGRFALIDTDAGEASN